MKKIYESPVVSFTHVGIEQNLLVLSWDVKGVGGQVSTPIVNEDPSSPVDDKSQSRMSLTTFLHGTTKLL